MKVHSLVFLLFREESERDTVLCSLRFVAALEDRRPPLACTELSLNRRFFYGLRTKFLLLSHSLYQMKQRTLELLALDTALIILLFFLVFKIWVHGQFYGLFW
jgi:hypothetical protein